MFINDETANAFTIIQEGLKMKKTIMYNVVVVVILLAFVLYKMTINATQYEDSMQSTTTTAEIAETIITTITTDETEPKHMLVELENEEVNNDDYLLAKIAMAEAEGESTETKALIIATVINRTKSENTCFPNNVYDVLYQKVNDTYQFSPMGNGRWERVEPSEDCWLALELAKTEELTKKSNGALYFESCSNQDNWHSRNLKFLYQSDSMRFYK